MSKRNRTVEIIANEWIEAKNEEKKANRKRIELEGELIALLGMKTEGSQTHDLDGFKVVITGKLNRKLDVNAYREIMETIPSDLCPVRVVEEYKIEDAGCRWLSENKPEVWGILAKAITTTPAKPSVTVTREG